MQQRSIAPSITPLTKNILIGLLVLYVIEMIVHQIGLIKMSTLAWNTGDSFNIWQPLSCFFTLDTPNPMTGNFDPIRVLIDLLMVGFFLPPTERTYKRRGLYRLLFLTFGLSVLFGAIFSVIGITGGFAYGIEPFLLAMLAAFCFTNPNAEILLFFILPLKASWIGWFSGLASFLFLVATRELSFVLTLSGWLAGLVFLAMKRRGPLKQIYKQTFGRRRKAKKPFVLIQGGKKDDGDVYH